MSNLVLPGEIPAYPHFFLALFDTENTVHFLPYSSNDMASWALFTLADDLMRDHPVTKINYVNWSEGKDRLLYVGTKEFDSIRAIVYAQGVHPLQIRAVCHHIQATALHNLALRGDTVESAPTTDLILPAKSLLVPH